MKKMNLMALLLGATLFTGLGVSTASAEGAKCGAGKCGDAKPEKNTTKCGGEKKADMEVKKCGAEKKEATKCGSAKATTKCGGSK